MDNFYNDERISSYLDGELSADEQARFEERLAESAELRQLVEELRAHRGSLDLLPRYRLEPEFAERVLRRAEQQMLTGGEGGSSDGTLGGSGGESSARSQAERDPGTQLAQPSHAVLDESRRWQRRIVRPLVYSGAAIAAAILIMVFTPSGGNEVAQNRSVEKPAQRSGPQGSNDSNRNAKDSKTDARLNESLETAHSKLVKGAAGRSLSQSDGYSAGIAAGASNKPAGGDSLSKSGSSAPKADQSGTAARMDDAELTDKPISRQGSDKQFPPEALGVVRQGVDGNRGKSGLAGGGQSDQSRNYSDASDIANATETLRRHGYGTPQANLLVASYEIRPDTSNSAIVGLLAKHRIAMHPASDGAPPVSSQLMDQVSREAGARSAAFLEQGQPIPDDKTAANGRPSQPPQLGAILAAQEPRRDLEIVYVEGSPKQITELVSDLDANKTEFRSLGVDLETMKKLSLQGQADDGATATDALGDVKAHWEAVPANKPTSDVLENRNIPQRESGGTAANGTVVGQAAANGAGANQAEAKVAASQRGNKAQTADKSPTADLSAPLAKGGEAETRTQPVAGFGAGTSGSDDRNNGVPFNAQTTEDVNPSRPKQAERGKGDEGESFGYAFWLHPQPAEAKQELKKEQLDRFKFHEQQVEDAPVAGPATGLAAAPKTPAPAPSAPPSAPAASPTAPPTPAKLTQPSAIQTSPALRATTHPEVPSAPKSAKEPAAAGLAGGRPEADKPVVEKPAESGGDNAKLRDESNAEQAPPVARPRGPSSSHDFERPLKRDASRAGAQADAKVDAKAGGAAAPSPRMQAILIFRIAPPPAAATPLPTGGPIPAEKAK